MNSLYLVKAYLHCQSRIFQKLQTFCIKAEHLLKIYELTNERNGNMRKAG